MRRPLGLTQRVWRTGFLGFIARRIHRALWIKISHIPDSEKLWRAVNKPEQVYAKTGKPKPAFFRDKSGLSCDIARFSTPEKSRVGHGPKPYPADSGLIEMDAGLIRKAGADVAHRPVKDPKRNYAHAQLTSLLTATGEALLGDSVTFKVPHKFRSS